MARSNLSLNLLITEKSAIWRFFLLCLLCLPALASAQECPAINYDETTAIKHVHDGDTVKLVDGRKIRLIGLNAPELARDGQPAEAFALKARDRLRQLLAESNNRVKLIHGNEAKDHYQRNLMHLFLPDGRNLQAALLSEGLASAITIPPNDRFSTCYRQAERQALCSKQGLWSRPIINIADLGDSETGFHVLRGLLKKVETSRAGTWLELKHGLSMRIAHEHRPLFDMARLQSLVGQEVLVRGWLQAKRKPKKGERFYLQIKHPSAIVEAKKALEC